MADNITTYNDDNDDWRFRDRLKLDNQTGSLTITNTTTEHAGVYQLEINHIRTLFHPKIFGGVKSVSVLERDWVTLNFDLTEIMDDDLIRWRFGNENTLIAEINAEADSFTVYDDVLDGRFRDRLKLDKQTGSLTITNITTEHVGVYQRQTNHMIRSFILTVYSELNIGALSLSKSHPNYIRNKNQHLNITELCQTCSDSVHCYDSVEAVVRLVVTALMGVAAAAAVIVLIYDIKSRRAEQDDFQHSSSSKRDIGNSISGEWSQFELRTRD
ncbi:SLAM family member 9 [Labeo rohita]|uniref:SLAM family member 9 n=1 Tax=Labeo rohita TaxID=84645 RepID=A0ABQ8LA04_LABRO|nr:SLAM family member 9 [Labeo rohita]